MKTTPSPLLLAALIAAAGLVPVPVLEAAGPTSPLFVTSYRSGPGSTEFFVIQDGQVTQTWSAPANQYQFAPAIRSTVRVLPLRPGYVGSEYTLAGEPTGVTYAYPDTVNMDLGDGTALGDFNYAIGYFDGTVYRFDENWENPSAVFSVPYCSGAITSDPSSDSLWIAKSGDRKGWPIGPWWIENRALDGTLLSSFNTTESPLGAYQIFGLALDPADGSLWVSRLNPNDSFGTAPVLEQYSREGHLLGSLPLPGLTGYVFGGMEFGPGPADTTPPEVLPVFTPTEPASGWFRGDVLLTWTVSDPESAVTSTGADPVSVISDTPGLAVTCVATSAGGTTSRTVTLRRDATPPTLTFEGYRAVFDSGDRLDVLASASDATSGVAPGSVQGRELHGYGWQFPGSTLLTASATDVAGNTGSATVTVVVTSSPQSLAPMAEQVKSVLKPIAPVTAKEAVDRVSKSLESAGRSPAWTGPASLEPVRGSQVFSDLHDASQALSGLPPVMASQALPAQKTIVDLTRKVAATAIIAARQAAGPAPAPPVAAAVKSAETAFSEARTLESAGQFPRAIQQDRLAWSKAELARKQSAR